MRNADHLSESGVKFFAEILMNGLVKNNSMELSVTKGIMNGGELLWNFTKSY